MVKNCDRRQHFQARGHSLLNTLTIREVNSTEIDSNFTPRETQDYAPLQRLATNNQKKKKKTLTTSKHSFESTNGDFPCNFKVNRDKLAWTNRRWMRKKGKRLTTTNNFQEQNLGSEEKIRPVGRIVKRWTGHVRMINQSNLTIYNFGPLRCLRKK